jgi:phosphoketolase
MDRQQILSRLKPLVGNNRQWEAFNNYLDDMINQHHKVMEQSTDVIALHRQQGAIAVLRKIKQLRDEVNGY